jgi:hypothetical protein
MDKASYGSGGAYTLLDDQDALTQQQKPQTMWQSLRSFFLKGSHKYEHRLLCGAPLVLLVCIAYAYYFGLVTMRWTVLETSYMFAISVTTVGYGLPTESDLDDLDSLQKWSLVGYSFAMVILAGCILAAIVAAVHEAAENEFDSVPHEEEHHRAGRSRAVEAGRRRAIFLRQRVRRQLLEILILAFVGVFAISFLEQWGFADSSIWVAETVTSLGFGEIQAESTGGMVFTIFYSLIATLLFARVIGVISAYPGLELENASLSEACAKLGFAHDKGPRPAMDEDVIAALFPTQAALARGDVALRVLLELGRVEKADVLDAYEVFDRLSGGMKELNSEAAVRAARGLGSSEV